MVAPDRVRFHVQREDLRLACDETLDLSVDGTQRAVWVRYAASSSLTCENIGDQPVFAPTGNQTHSESEWFFRNLLAANKAANPLLLSSHSLLTAGKHQDDAFHLAQPKAVTLLHLWPCEETVRFLSAPTPSFIIEQDPKTTLAAQLAVSRTTFLLLLKLTLTHLTVSVAA